jgi:hypothetical protein
MPGGLRYALFALKSHLWKYMIPGEEPVYMTETINGWAVYVVKVYKAGVEQTISSKRTRILQETIDHYTKVDPHNMYCRAFDYSSRERAIVEQWPYPPEIKVKFENDHVYINLHNVPDYKLMYDEINISLYYSCKPVAGE